MSKPLALTALLAALFAPSAHAQQAYAGAALAGGTLHYRALGVPGAPEVDDHILFGRLYGGYAFNDTFALEGGWAANGTARYASGATTTAEIPVDELGRAELPMIKQAFDEDAVLRLNRQKGHYMFNGRYSIRERADGAYGGADLRAACEQLLGAQRASGYRWRLLGKDCAGVKFVYRLSEPAPRIVHRDAAGVERPLPLASGQPFENETMGLYQVALYRFADWPAEGTVLARSAPLGIGTLYTSAQVRRLCAAYSTLIARSRPSTATCPA